MVVVNLKTLVLRGVSVVNGLVADSRLGFGYPTGSHLRATPISMRHSDCRDAEPERPAELAASNDDASQATGQRAGRPGSGTGVLVTTTPATRTDTRWRGLGGSQATVAVRSGWSGPAVSVVLSKTTQPVTALPNPLAQIGLRRFASAGLQGVAVRLRGAVA